VYGADDEPVVADLARHFTAAAVLGDPGPAIEYSLRAAASAMRSFGHAEAIELLEPLVEFTGERSPDRLRVLLALGDARQRRGNHVAAREAFMEAFIVATNLPSTTTAPPCTLRWASSNRPTCPDATGAPRPASCGRRSA
jgi:hypothetical protein